MIKTIRGRIWKFGNNIDTDVLYPGKYLPIIEEDEMAAHALEGVDPDFPKQLKAGDILVAGSNFGCGSSREQAATCLKAAGIGCVVAQSFSRIFYRNAINQGLPLVQPQESLDNLKDGDVITVDFTRGIIKTDKKEFSFLPLPGFIMEILEAGGLIPSVKRRIESAKQKP